MGDWVFVEFWNSLIAQSDLDFNNTTSHLYTALQLKAHFHKENVFKHVSKGTITCMVGCSHSGWDLTQSQSLWSVSRPHSPTPSLSPDLLCRPHYHPSCFLIHLYLFISVTRAHSQPHYPSDVLPFWYCQSRIPPKKPLLILLTLLTHVL